MGKRKTYSIEFKEEAIRLVADGATATQVEIDLGIGKGTVSRWVREKRALQGDAFCGSGNVRPSEREYKLLQKELYNTKQELEILKKALAIFSKDPNRYSNS
jgi:transposase